MLIKPLIFENKATKNNLWNGTQMIDWVTNDEVRMNNQFFFINDSTFITSDIFMLKRL